MRAMARYALGSELEVAAAAIRRVAHALGKDGSTSRLEGAAADVQSYAGKLLDESIAEMDLEHRPAQCGQCATGHPQLCAEVGHGRQRCGVGGL